MVAYSYTPNSQKAEAQKAGGQPSIQTKKPTVGFEKKKKKGQV